MSVIYRLAIAFITISLVVFIIGGVITYHVMKREVDVEQRLFLREREKVAANYVRNSQPKEKVFWSKLTIEPIDPAVERRVFSDTLVLHAGLERMEPHLKLVSEQQFESGWYRFEIYDVIVESDDIVDGVVESLITMYLILFGSVLILAFTSSYFLLKPFRATLSSIEGFSLERPDGLTFPKSRVSEFKKLNQFLSEMTEKVQSDYRSLKEFSENASHEIQTPIAVAQGKLDLLIQDPSLNEDQMMLVTSAQGALHHLKRLGKALALLTKLDNKEFIDEKPLDVVPRVRQVMSDMHELADMKNLKVAEELEGSLPVRCNEVLLEIMLTNLVSNAIKHNVEDGYIKSTLDENRLLLENSGKTNGTAASEMFRRFKKGSNSESLGLGMAIVKKICDYYHWKIDYDAENDAHKIAIQFAQN
ncbi:MAG: HAMP domain-containing sensor histidine kinase [Bacteroidota bacterium]